MKGLSNKLIDEIIEMDKEGFFNLSKPFKDEPELWTKSRQEYNRDIVRTCFAIDRCLFTSN